MLAERGITVDAATVFRWVQKFGPEIAKRSFSRRTWRGLSWHVDEKYVCVAGAWCYLRRAVELSGQLIDSPLTKRRDTQAVRALLRQAMDNSRLYQPRAIFTDKAPAYAKVISEINQRREAGDEILHCDRKWRNNRIESDHAALKRITEPGKGFRSLRTAKATLQGIEAMRTIKRGQVHGKPAWVLGEISFVNSLFRLAA